MWIERTTDEIDQWHAATRRAARRRTLFFAGLIWAVCTVLLASGWYFVSVRTGMVLHRERPGTFWSRLPITAAVMCVLALWFYFREMRRELKQATQCTICPACDTAGASNAGVTCQCGGVFVAQSAMKWVDDEETA